MLSINPSYLILNILTLLTFLLTLKKYKIEKKDNLTTIYHYDKKKLENDYLEMGIEKLRYHLF